MEYRQKRDFTKTPEPAGGGKAAAPVGALRFVVQRHDASTLHFDFRLEFEGILKSWAIPKQPNGKVGSRRLAVQVEDHPLEYGQFEGEIPEGNYGAGSVTIWDSGIWTPEGNPAQGFREGKINFVLAGSVLQGRWTLVRFGQRSLKSARQDNWLLIKRHDTAPAPRTAGAVKHPMGSMETPQLATLVTTVPVGSDWWFEPKLDGYRLLARIDDGHVQLLTRNGNDWTARFEEIAKALQTLPCKKAMLDGEVVVFDANGISNFQRLQNALSEHRATMQYVLFDLLYLDEWDLRPAPLSERKSLLQQLLAASTDPLRYGDHFAGDGASVFSNACDLGLEGVIAKQVDAAYVSGRSGSWLKLKCLHEQEFVIVGYTDPQGARQGFGALLLATRDDADAPLRYVGRVGTGFDRPTLQSLWKQLTDLERSETAVSGLTAKSTRGEVHWVLPKLVAQVSFAGWTNDHRIRHAVFRGLREDKKAEDVVAEKPEEKPVPTKRARDVRLTNPDKILFEDPPITKRALADYWKKVGPLALPYISQRPLTLLRCPDGIEHCFVQKHIGANAPGGIEKVDVDQGAEPYAVVDHEGGFVGLVQWGVIEVHTWGSREAHLDQPDILVFDLDPADDLPWSAVIDAAEEMKSRLEALGLVPFAKLTGGKGLHIVVPVVPGPDWEAVKIFTRAVATELVKAEPDHFTVSMSKAKRPGKIFIDYLRNDREATAIASYSPRARDGAPLAIPISWPDLYADRKSRPISTLADFAGVVRRHKRKHPWHDFEASRRTLTD
ncbi:MAG TPA: DNA ligase D [Thermomicrobiales bacterium]|nr:DNA ligase D [Thermomicrobiales bacterium]